MSLKNDWEMMVAVGAAQVWTLWVNSYPYTQRAMAEGLEEIINAGILLGVIVKRRRKSSTTSRANLFPHGHEYLIKIIAADEIKLRLATVRLQTRYQVMVASGVGSESEYD